MKTDYRGVYMVIAVLIAVLVLASVHALSSPPVCELGHVDYVEDLPTGRQYMLLERNGAYTVKQGGQSCNVYVGVE